MDAVGPDSLYSPEANISKIRVWMNLSWSKYQKISDLYE